MIKKNNDGQGYITYNKHCNIPKNIRIIHFDFTVTKGVIKTAMIA